MAKRILVADDSLLMRRQIRTILELDGDIEICAEAANGIEAVQKVQECHPDLALLDFLMPGMNGLEATREIKKAQAPNDEPPFSRRTCSVRWQARPTPQILPGNWLDRASIDMTADNKLGYAFLMTDKRLRAIAALEVELAMTEAHAKRLSTVAPNSTNPEQQHAMAALVKEENDRAEILRRQIHVLRSHV